MKLFYIILFLFIAVIGIAITVGLIVPTKRTTTPAPCCKGCPECTCRTSGKWQWLSYHKCPCPNCIYKKMPLYQSLYS